MLLQTSNLHVRYRLKRGSVNAVNGVSFGIEYGDSLGIVGESGCGKTTLLKALICLLPPNAEVTQGKILFEGQDLNKMGPRELRKLRWKQFSIIPQSAMNALDPVYTIKDQITEAIEVHEEMSKPELQARLIELLDLVGLEKRCLESFPHQLSGGMRQRAAIAMALALNPKLVIADEPTTALDVVTQRHIIDEIKRLQARFDLALIYVTHDIYVVAETCEKVAVMYAGKVLELGPREALFERPLHPYTLALQMAFPSLEEAQQLISLSGAPPDLTRLPEGCKFFERCPFSVAECARNDPPLIEVEENRYAACLRIADIDTLRDRAMEEDTWALANLRLK